MSPEALGIKNSWKYEKDLILIFNPNIMFNAIIRLGNFGGY